MFTKSDMTSVGERFSAMRRELQDLDGKATKLESDVQQHERVLSAVADLGDDRRTYRLVGEVLTAMPAKDARVALSQQRDALRDAATQFRGRVETKEAEFLAFQREHNVQVRPLRDIKRASE